MAMGFNKFRGGDNVRYGFYWNVKEWEAQIVPREGGELNGPAEVSYVRLPLVAVLMLAPLMGALYAFFLPFIGIAMVLMFLTGRLRRLIQTTPPAADAEASASRDRREEHQKAA